MGLLTRPSLGSGEDLRQLLRGTGRETHPTKCRLPIPPPSSAESWEPEKVCRIFRASGKIRTPGKSSNAGMSPQPILTMPRELARKRRRPVVGKVAAGPSRMRLERDVEPSRASRRSEPWNREISCGPNDQPSDCGAARRPVAGDADGGSVDLPVPEKQQQHFASPVRRAGAGGHRSGQRLRHQRSGARAREPSDPLPDP
jgi:hypothetical protein